ncbi:SUMF1/EgtB/PvdO family nonheme iron enzyme [candidate division KSB1 bacterium]|nr:SUMF1/EgtB/PvdO family nonheme iron enzyme [candidate division KSB1 bacterium]
MKKLSIWLAIVIVSFSLTAFAQEYPGIEKFPYTSIRNLAVKADWLQRDLRRDNLYKGLVMPRVLLPPSGNPDHSTAHQEDAGNRSGPYLAALSYQYAVSKDPQIREWANETFQAIEILEKVTGVPGCVARSFNISEAPQPHEEWFFFPAEWHASQSMPGYRWLGDPSSDTIINLFHGLAVYFDLCADNAHQKRIAALIDRIMTRIINHNMRIVDIDGKMTLWGNFSPELEHDPLNSLIALALLKIAHHVTRDGRFDYQYYELINKHEYAEHVLLAKSFEVPQVPWDDQLGMQALYHLLNYERDAALTMKYMASLERYWGMLNSDMRVYFHVIYSYFVPDNFGFTEKSLDYLINWAGAWRQKRDELMPRQDGSVDHIIGIWQESPQDYLLTYWCARYHKILAVDGKIINPRNANLSGRGKNAPRGMVLVPAGDFIMGSDDGDADEYPQRIVHLDAYYIDVFEVTNAEYAKFNKNHKFDPDRANEAVTGVSWHEANAYAKFVGRRLPTEAEWEKAARGSDGRRYPWGNHYELSMSEPSGLVQEGVWRAGISPFGAYKMAGHAWEWTADWYKPYTGNTTTSPAYGEKYKVIRGGSSFNDQSMQRCAHRYYLDPSAKNSGYKVGFRCVKSVR